MSSHTVSHLHVLVELLSLGHLSSAQRKKTLTTSGHIEVSKTDSKIRCCQIFLVEKFGQMFVALANKGRRVTRGLKLRTKKHRKPKTYTL